MVNGRDGSSESQTRVLATAGALLAIVLAVTYRGGAEVGASEPSPCLAPGAASVAELERCVDLHPNDVGLLLALGDRYVATRHGDAYALFERAIRIDPRDADALMRAAAAALDARPQTARALATQALALRPNSADVLALLAAIERRSQ